MEHTDSSITFYVGSEAFSQLSNQAFLSAWDKLYRRCPWATVFQSAGFVNTWYHAYKSQFSPVLVAQHDPNLGLTGLLSLAISIDGKHLIGAGSHQAEYQAWLASPTNENFIARALFLIKAKFPGRYFTLKYVPGNVPLKSILKSRLIGSRVEIRSYRRPLMVINSESLFASLKKKSNKSRLNRLKRMGEVNIERITDMNRFEQIIDTIIQYYDIRQGGVNNALPFFDDPHKKPFHLALMNCPGILHVTVLKVGNDIAAAHIGLKKKDWVHLGIVAHSPFYAKHSPGKVHMMLLGLKLAEEGVTMFDLTPVADGYKERFANEHDDVFEITIAKSRSAFVIRTFRKRSFDVLRTLIVKLHIHPHDLRLRIETLKRFRFSQLLRCMIENKEIRIYDYIAETSQEFRCNRILNRNSISDLLKFRPFNSSQSKQEFLANALSRMERGEDVYTYVSDGQLLHCGWLAEGQKRVFLYGINQEFEFPRDSAVLFDFVTHPKVRNRDLCQDSLMQMLRDAVTLHKRRHIYVPVWANNLQLRKVLDKLGFRYQGSQFYPGFLRKTVQKNLSKVS